MHFQLKKHDPGKPEVMFFLELFSVFSSTACELSEEVLYESDDLFDDSSEIEISK